MTQASVLINSEGLGVTLFLDEDAGHAGNGLAEEAGASCWAPGDLELHLKNLASERVAADLLGRYQVACAEAIAQRPNNTDIGMSELREKERELRDKLCAAHQDYIDTCEADQDAQERREGAEEIIRQKLGTSGFEMAELRQECATLEHELGCEEQFLSERAAAASHTLLAAQEAHAYAASEVAEAQQAEGLAEEAHKEARTELLRLQETLSSAQHVASNEMVELRRRVLSDCKSQSAVAEEGLAEAAARREDGLRRAGMWRTLCESSRIRANTCRENVQRVEQRAAESGTKAEGLRKQLEAVQEKLASAVEYSEVASRDLAHSQQQRRVALGIAVFAFGFVLARLLTFLG